MCLMACEHGFMFDENGCKTCECFRCAIPMCANRCKYGTECQIEAVRPVTVISVGMLVNSVIFSFL